MASEKKPKKDKKNDLARDAMKIAKKLAAKNQLQLQEILTDTQKRAAKLLGEGFTIEEVSKKCSVTEHTINSWMEKPSFLVVLNETTKKVGFSDKDFRIRFAKRMMSEISQKMIEKIDTLDEMGFEKLQRLFLEMSASIQKDTEEKVLSVGGDLSVLIVNHFKSKGHEAESLEDVFNKDSQKFPTFDTIDAEFEELKEDD
jgi:hypothetical protein